MVTIAIIGIAMALSIPTIRQAMHDRRLQQEAIDFMNVFREARSRAMFRGRAHLVSVDTSGTNTIQRMIEGDTSSCLLSNFAIPPSREIYVNTSLRTSTEVRIENITPGVAVIEFCYTPMGRMFYRYGRGASFTEDNGATTGQPLNGGFLYRTISTVNPATVARRIFIPLGGVPRLAP